MKLKLEKLTKLLLVALMMLGILTALPMKVQAADPTEAIIDLSTLIGTSTISNSANPAESQWVYNDFVPDNTLFLDTQNGRYRIIGRAQQPVLITPYKTGIVVTLDNMTACHIYGAHGVTYNLVGNNKVSEKIYGRPGLAFNVAGMTTFKGNGNLVIESYGNNCGAKITNNNVDLTIDEAASVVFVGAAGYQGIENTFSNNRILLGDTASLTITNNSTTTETHEIQRKNLTSELKWKLTNATTTDNLFGNKINVSIPKGKSGKITREFTNVVDIDYSSILLKMKTIAGANYYEIYRSTKKNKGFKKVNSTDGVSLYYLDMYLKAGTTYYYKIRGVTVSSGKKTYSKFQPVFGAATKKLPKVNDVTVTGNNRRIDFDWLMTTDPELVNKGAIQIYYATKKTGKISWKVLQFDANKAHPCLSNLKPSTTYYYKMRYVYYNGSTSYGPFTTIQSVKTTASGIGAPIPFDGYTSALPNWAPEPADYFQVYRSTKKNSGFKLVGTTTDPEYYDYFLKANTTYYYRVRTVTKVGGKLRYGKFKTYSYTTNPLPQPTDVVITKNIFALTQTFTWVNASNYTGVQVYYSTSLGKKAKWKAISFRQSPFDLAYLSPGTTYYIKYRYIYSGGSVNYGPFSDIVTIVH